MRNAKEGYAQGNKTEKNNKSKPFLLKVKPPDPQPPPFTPLPFIQTEKRERESMALVYPEAHVNE